MSGITGVRVVPSKGDGVTKTQGTKVLTADGAEIKGVHRIILTADVNDVWRAEIHCLANVQEMSALAVVRRPGLWGRMWHRVKRWRWMNH